MSESIHVTNNKLLEQRRTIVLSLVEEDCELFQNTSSVSSINYEVSSEDSCSVDADLEEDATFTG